MCDTVKLSMYPPSSNMLPSSHRGGRETGERHRCTYISPGVPTGVELGPALADVGGIAVEFEPEVLDLPCAKCFEMPRLNS